MPEVSAPLKSEEKKEYGKYDKWEVEGWARTLEEAEMIKADPEKMKLAKQCMVKKLTATKKVISSLGDLKEARQELPDEATEDDSE